MTESDEQLLWNFEWKILFRTLKTVVKNGCFHWRFWAFESKFANNHLFRLIRFNYFLLGYQWLWSSVFNIVFHFLECSSGIFIPSFDCHTSVVCVSSVCLWNWMQVLSFSWKQNYCLEQKRKCDSNAYGKKKTFCVMGIAWQWDQIRKCRCKVNKATRRMSKHRWLLLRPFLPFNVLRAPMFLFLEILEIFDYSCWIGFCSFNPQLFTCFMVFFGFILLVDNTVCVWSQPSATGAEYTKAQRKISLVQSSLAAERGIRNAMSNRR